MTLPPREGSEAAVHVNEMFGTGQAGVPAGTARIPTALRRRENSVQLIKFGVVGAAGYLVNLAAYTLLPKEARLQYVAAATVSFLVAATWNYWWNRTWTFRAQRPSDGTPSARKEQSCVTRSDLRRRVRAGR